MSYHRIFSKSKAGEQELFTLPGHLLYLQYQWCSGVRVAPSLVFCAVLLFVLFIRSLLSILRFTTSNYPFGTNAS